MKVKVLKESRLNGADVHEGEVVEIDNALALAWIKAGRAETINGTILVNEKKPGRLEKAIKPDKTEKAIKDPESEKSDEGEDDENDRENNGG
jgi:hypothetical protein